MNNLFSGNNAILALVLLFVLCGGDTFDTTQLLLALALFSTIDPNATNNGCLNNPFDAQGVTAAL